MSLVTIGDDEIDIARLLTNRRAIINKKCFFVFVFKTKRVYNTRNSEQTRGKNVYASKESLPS